MTMPETYHKQCPNCKRAAALDATSCLGCGHIYRTKFPEAPPVPEPTLIHSGSPVRQVPTVQPPPPQIVIINQPGIQPGAVNDAVGTHPVAAAIICGFLITGVGQMINRQIAKGVVLLLSAIVIGLMTVGIGSAVIWLIALIDAILIANRLNRGESVGEWQFF